ncbi:MAG: Clp protease N-terminal domain-containing protein, partial [Chloroflexota bacterium]|nr:Clp protease N-terminal domain-containing protein [Chloroflexota bacterium]
MTDTLERFTPASRDALRFARAEAARMRHATIGPEHILLGLLLESEGLAGRVLRDMGLHPQQVQRLVARLSGAQIQRNTDPTFRNSTEVL